MNNKVLTIVNKKSSWLLLAIGSAILAAQSSDTVLVVVNDSSPLSRRIGDYYVSRRQVPLKNICRIRVRPDEEITRVEYERSVEDSIAKFLRANRLTEQILYIVATQGVPLKIAGLGHSDRDTTAAAVDSELTLLYRKLHGERLTLPGMIRNPYYGQRDSAFTHPRFPMYLVTRLAAYNFAEVRGMIDRCRVAVNKGRIVLDLRSSGSDEGNDWLRQAARLLPKDRVILEESDTVLYGQHDVIAYASWGSNDRNRKRRFSGNQYLPGAIVTEYVSTNGRTFERPPDSWNIATWKEGLKFFAGSPQTLTADYLHEGATGCSGHVYEPFLQFTPRPDQLLPAYFGGRNLAESYYAAIPALSWQNIVVGDPLCRVK